MKMLSVAMVMAFAGLAQAAPSQPEPAQPAAQAAQPAALDRASRAAEALSRGDNVEALNRADEALRANPKSGWAHYNRAWALAGLNRIDEAVQAYDQATASFAANDTRGRSLALWGKAHVLYRVGRCNEASQTFGEYAKLVGSSDPQAVNMASERSSSCKPARESAATASAAPAAKEVAETATKTATKPEIAKPEPAAATSGVRTKTTDDDDKSGLPSLANPPK